MVALFLSLGLLIVVAAVLGRLTKNTTTKNTATIIVIGILVALAALFFI